MNPLGHLGHGILKKIKNGSRGLVLDRLVPPAPSPRHPGTPSPAAAGVSGARAAGTRIAPTSRHPDPLGQSIPGAVSAPRAPKNPLGQGSKGIKRHPLGFPGLRKPVTLSQG
jgi:hypothetical protein